MGGFPREHLLKVTVGPLSGGQLLTLPGCGEVVELEQGAEYGVDLVEVAGLGHGSRCTTTLSPSSAAGT